MVTQVTNYDRYITPVTGWSHISQSQITQLCYTKKNIKDSRTDDII